MKAQIASLAVDQSRAIAIESDGIPTGSAAAAEFARLSSTPRMDFSRDEPEWRLSTRIAFRFVFAYFLLYVLPFPLAHLPHGEAVISWVGRSVLHVNYKLTDVFTGSSDMAYHYVQLLCTLTLAAAATILWSLLDSRRKHYERMHQWLRLGVRLLLGSAMIGYGMSKLIPTQMPAPGLSTLIQPYGQSSPMHLLWTFMGASTGYEMFAGAAEMLGGILVFFPALTTLGALVLIAVLSNVFMLNMCYDVPVKLFSFHLLLMAVFLAAPDLRRLSDLFLYRRKAQLKASPPLFKRKWLNRGLLALQFAYGLFVLIMCLYSSYQDKQHEAIKPPFYGIWSVEEYVVDGKVQPPLLTEASRWRYVTFDSADRLTVQSVDDSVQRFFLQLDQAKRSFSLAKRLDPKWKTELAYQNPQPDVLTVAGDFDGHHMTASLRRTNESKYLLTSRGFHWINEYPMQQ